MRIGVLSDTHIPSAAPCLPTDLLRGLDEMDLILHAGDILRMSVIESLGVIADVCAVYGNMDPPEVRAELPALRIIEVAGRRIGLVHGSGPPFGLARRAQHAFRAAEGGAPDIVVFGHSHHATEDRRGKILRFNPGSPTDKRFTRYRSYGILTLGETVESRVIPLR